jgi:hypothetical protein
VTAFIVADSAFQAARDLALSHFIPEQVRSDSEALRNDRSIDPDGRNSSHD